MKTAFVYPGGGTQQPGMLAPFLDAWPEVEAALDRFEDDDLESLLLDADTDTLLEVPNMLQAVLTTGIVATDAVQKRYGATPDVVTGHSLGQITAMGVADVLSRPDAAQFAAERGQAMADAEETAGPGKMVAVSLADPETVEDAASEVDGVSVGAYNGPRQTLVSGREDAVDAVCDRIEEAGGRVVLSELDVATASHSPVMEPAADRLADIVERFEFSDPSVPVVSDTRAEPYERAEVPQRDLPEQLVSPIQWVAAVERLGEMGVERVVEMPPAGVLADLVSRIDSDLEAVAIETPADAEAGFGDD
ncbi:ACP S-malonyltransferase [Halobacteriales archaeon QS_1_68_20]|nr:MAG: ACP S-malonyltransferase [Halobacteriales archaeon QS_1_68_20]